MSVASAPIADLVRYATAHRAWSRCDKWERQDLAVLFTKKQRDYILAGLTTSVENAVQALPEDQRLNLPTSILDYLIDAGFLPRGS